MTDPIQAIVQQAEVAAARGNPAGVRTAFARLAPFLRQQTEHKAAKWRGAEAELLLQAGDPAGAAQAVDAAVAGLARGAVADPELVNTLIGLFFAAGNALYALGRLTDAVAVYGRAIALQEGQRAALEPRGEWTPELRNDLAMAYSNRGNALAGQGRPDAAVADYDQAIALSEGLCAALKPREQWTPELRNDLAMAYSNRGNALAGQGRLAAAVADYDQAIALREGLRAALEARGQWPPELRNDLAAAYINRGAALCRQRRLDAAVADYGQAIALGEGLRAAREPRGEWTPALRNALAGAYTNRGVALRAQGRLDVAVADYGQAIALGEGLRAALEPREQWTPELRNDLAAAYSNRGVTLAYQGRLDAAVADHGQAIALEEGLRAALEPRGEWHPELRNALAGPYTNRGNALRDQGRLDAAVADHDQAVALEEGLRAALEPRGEWHPELRNALAAAYSNRGVTLVQQGRLDAAVADHGQAIALEEGLRAALEPRGEWTPALRNDLATVYMTRGYSLVAQGRLAAAVADFGQAIALREGLRAALKPTGQWSPELRNDLAMAYSSRGAVLYAQERLDTAMADYEQGIALNEPLPDGVLIEADRLRFLLYANLSRLLDRLSDPPSWAQAKSQRMAAFLEQVPATGAEQGHAPALYLNFALFHARWLAWCVRAGRLDLIPEILAIVQGREVAAEVLDQINLEDPHTPEEVRAFHRLRLELRKLNARIEAVIGGGKLGGGEGPGIGRTGPPAGLAWDQATYAELLAEHQGLTARLPALRQSAAQCPGYDYLELPYRRLGLEDLQRGLAPGEALVLLIDPAEGAPGVLLVRAAGRPHWQPVPELPAWAQGVREFDAQAGRSRGYRHGRLAPDPSETQTPVEAVPERRPGLLGALSRLFGHAHAKREPARVPPPEEPPPHIDPGFWERMAEALRDHLWAGLGPQLQGITQLTVIPHGDLHLLPVTAGAPPGRAICRYPGLAFLAQRRGLYGARPASSARAEPAVGLIGFAGEHGDIPLAEAETAALAALYRGHGVAVHHPSGYPYQPEPDGLLHIACHGGSDPTHPERVALFIAKGGPSNTRQVLNQDAVVASPTPPRDIYFSACLGGQTVEGLSGTPSGLVSACFRRNARWVAGSLVSIPDKWAMLLALLTHQALVREGLLLPAALAEGKRRLAQGDWYPDTGERLQGVLDEPLRRLAEAGVQATWVALWGYDDPAERRRQFREQAVPSLLQGWDLSDAEIAVLHQRLRSHGPETLAEPLAAALTDLWPSRPRVPPQPALGTLIHGLVVFGENAQ